MKTKLMIALIMGIGMMTSLTMDAAKGGDCCKKDAICCTEGSECAVEDADCCEADAKACASEAVCCDGGDKKAKVVASTDELVASFVPATRAELDAIKAMKLTQESEAIIAAAKLAAPKNPEGKPNRMYQKDGSHSTDKATPRPSKGSRTRSK